MVFQGDKRIIDIRQGNKLVQERYVGNKLVFTRLPQEGLAISFDGIDNEALDIHNPDTTQWIDSIRGIKATIQNATWGSDKGIQLNGGTSRIF